MSARTIMRRMVCALSLVAGSTSLASAAPVYDSNVDFDIFLAALGTPDDWIYYGQVLPEFSGWGMAEVAYRDAGWSNTFGFALPDHTAQTEIFAAHDPVDTTAMVTGYDTGYVFYFASDAPADTTGATDDNQQFTNSSTGTGGTAGAAEGDVDVFRKESTWAFFYDDGGGQAAADDNDFDDLVVTFSQASSVEVPEPGAAGLMLAALPVLAALGRRKRKQ